MHQKHCELRPLCHLGVQRYHTNFRIFGTFPSCYVNKISSKNPRPFESKELFIVLGCICHLPLDLLQSSLQWWDLGAASSQATPFEWWMDCWWSWWIIRPTISQMIQAWNMYEDLPKINYKHIYIKVCSTTHGANGIDHPWKNTHQHCQHLDFELIHLHSCLRAWEVESQNRILDSWVMLLSVKIPLNIPIVSIGICPITVNIYSNIPRFHIDFPVLPLKHLCFNQIKMIPIQYTHHMPSLIAGPPIGVRSYNPSALFVERWGSWQPSDEPPAVGTPIHHP